jgi:hypothetical protein
MLQHFAWDLSAPKQIDSPLHALVDRRTLFERRLSPHSK